MEGPRITQHQTPSLDDCSPLIQNEGLSLQFSKRKHVVSPRRGVLYRYTYYAVNMYNEVRERRVKKREGDCKGRREEVEGTVEEVEEGRQTILAKDRRYSNAIVAVAAACTAKHFYRLPWLQDNRHFFPPS